MHPDAHPGRPRRGEAAALAAGPGARRRRPTWPLCSRRQPPPGCWSPSTDGSGLRFAHDLFREVLAAELPASARRGLHRDLGAALETARAEGAVVHPAELAAHFLAAASGGDADAGDPAVRYAREAAADATQRLAFEDAVTLLERALALCRPGPSRRSHPSRSAAGRGRRPPPGRAPCPRGCHLPRCVRRGTSAGRPRRRGACRHRPASRRGEDRPFSRAGQPCRAARRGGRSSATAHPQPSRHRCRPPWPARCTTRWRRTRWPRRVPIAEHAVEIARDSGDPSATAEALLRRCTTCAGAPGQANAAPRRARPPRPRGIRAGAVPAYDCAPGCSALRPSSNSATPAPSPKLDAYCAGVDRARRSAVAVAVTVAARRRRSARRPPRRRRRSGIPGRAARRGPRRRRRRSGSATSSAGSWPASPAGAAATAAAGPAPCRRSRPGPPGAR